jgi:hypothetical protein
MIFLKYRFTTLIKIKGTQVQKDPLCPFPAHKCPPAPANCSDGCTSRFVQVQALKELEERSVSVSSKDTDLNITRSRHVSKHVHFFVFGRPGV